MDAQGSGKRHRRRYGIGACIAVALLASLGLVVASGFGSEQAATQNITVTLGKGTTTASATGLVAGLTKITARNTGSAPAQFILGRLLPGKTFADLQAATQRTDQIPEGVVVVSTSFFGIAPGKSFTTTIKLPPGDYVAAQPPQNGKGVGPAAQFSLANGTAGGSPPATVGKVVLYDYGINAPTSIAGRGTLEVNNIGQNYHFLESLRLNPGVNADKVVAGIKAGTLHGAPPGQGFSIIGVVAPSAINYVNINLPPGTYVIACFNANRHSAGHNHSQYGMVRKLTVK